MFHVKNHKQQHIFDPWGYLGPKRRKELEKSWAGLFRSVILTELPVDMLRTHYHEWNGRPSKELYSMMGLMILQQMHDLTDEQAVEQFCFNMQWHYALNITNPGDSASYISHKTLWSMRDKLASDGIYHEIFDAALQKLATTFSVDLHKQRMDSVHIRSNMRHLGRIGLFVRTIKKFLHNLKRQHRPLFDSLDNSLTTRYLGKKAEAIFSLVKPSESAHTLDQLAEDMFCLIQRFAAVSRVNEMSSFTLLTRLFNEQCVIESDERGAGDKAVARPNQQVASDSLQNPSDPDAGYSGHKGKGYQAQIVENYSEADSQLSLLTHVAVESAAEHDANALVPALEHLRQRDMAPQELVADSLYGSDANCQQGRDQYGTEVVAPVMSGNQKNTPLADFTVNEQGRITSCPRGVSPERVKRKKDRFSAAFAVSSCDECPHLNECPVSKGKKAYYYRYTGKDVRIAARKRYERSDAFKNRYRFRAGVEATMSELDRRTGVKHLRVRGRKAVHFAVIMKAIGLNILRASRFRRRNSGPEAPLGALFPAVLVVFFFVKEQFRRHLRSGDGIMLNSRLKIGTWPEFVF
ncbi:MAG: transposase [Desulfocapsaceae bacterium]